MRKQCTDDQRHKGSPPVRSRRGRLIHVDSIGITEKALCVSRGVIYPPDEDSNFPQAIGHKQHPSGENETADDFQEMNTRSMDLIKDVSPDNGPELGGEFDDTLKKRKPQPIRRAPAEPYKAEVNGTMTPTI